MALIFVRGTLVDGLSVGKKGMIAYQLEDSGVKCEVLAMSPIPNVRQGEFLELPVRPAVRKNSDGSLRDQVTFWYDDKEQQQGVSIFGGVSAAPHQAAAVKPVSSQEMAASANGHGGK